MNEIWKIYGATITYIRTAKSNAVKETKKKRTNERMKKQRI